MSHLSHVYETGGLLYVTVVAGRRGGSCRSVAGRQGTACQRQSSPRRNHHHHHAVGRDHAPYLAAEVGENGIELPKAIKAHLDPNGILNPGALIRLTVGDNQLASGPHGPRPQERGEIASQHFAGCTLSLLA